MERLYEGALDALGDALGRVLSGGSGGVIGWLIIAAAVAVIAGLVTRYLRQVTRDPGGAEVEVPVLTRSAAAWRAEAADHERAGRWADAVRCRYRALLADLAVDGVVEEVPGRTVGEYAREVRRSRPGVAEEFGAASRTFQRIWYGAAAAGPDDARSLDDLGSRVLAGVR